MDFLGKILLSSMFYILRLIFNISMFVYISDYFRERKLAEKNEKNQPKKAKKDPDGLIVSGALLSKMCINGGPNPGDGDEEIVETGSPVPELQETDEILDLDVSQDVAPEINEDQGVLYDGHSIHPIDDYVPPFVDIPLGEDVDTRGKMLTMILYLLKTRLMLSMIVQMKF